jgi:hypothetical protein
MAMIMGAFTWLENNRSDFNKLYKLKKRKISLKFEEKKNEPSETFISPFKTNSTTTSLQPVNSTKKLPSWAKRATTDMEIDLFIQEHAKMAVELQEEYQKTFTIPSFLKVKKD